MCTPCHSLASCPSHSRLACKWHQLLLLHFSANHWFAVMHRLEQCCLHPHDSLSGPEGTHAFRSYQGELQCQSKQQLPSRVRQSYSVTRQADAHLRIHCAGRLQLVQQHMCLPHTSMIVLVRMWSLQWTVELHGYQQESSGCCMMQAVQCRNTEFTWNLWLPTCVCLCCQTAAA